MSLSVIPCTRVIYCADINELLLAKHPLFLANGTWLIIMPQVLCHFFYSLARTQAPLRQQRKIHVNVSVAKFNTAVSSFSFSAASESLK